MSLSSESDDLMRAYSKCGVKHAGEFHAFCRHACPIRYELKYLLFCNAKKRKWELHSTIRAPCNGYATSLLRRLHLWYCEWECKHRVKAFNSFGSKRKEYVQPLKKFNLISKYLYVNRYDDCWFCAMAIIATWHVTTHHHVDALMCECIAICTLHKRHARMRRHQNYAKSFRMTSSSFVISRTLRRAVLKFNWLICG